MQIESSTRNGGKLSGGLLLGGLIVLLVSPVPIVIGNSEGATIERLRADGRVAKGTLIGREREMKRRTNKSSSSDPGVNYVLKYSFDPAASVTWQQYEAQGLAAVPASSTGQSETARIKVSQQAFRSTAQGDQIDLVFDPVVPGHARKVTEVRNFSAAVWYAASAALMVLGALLALIGWRRRRAN